jgi:hypothetical protein
MLGEQPLYAGGRGRLVDKYDYQESRITEWRNDCLPGTGRGKEKGITNSWKHDLLQALGFGFRKYGC